MSMPPREHEPPVVEWLRDLFATHLLRVLLSIIILLSVLPFRWVTDYEVLFFAAFAVELALRGTVFYHDLRHRRVSRLEVLLLLLDLLATLSFLPLHAISDDARLLRLFRLSRMFLLLGYWGPIVHDVALILMKRERRYQLSFVVITVILLTFTSALVLEHFRVQGIDFNGDGNPHNDHSFWSMLWWSFLQIESADNILKDPNATLGFCFSIFLTIAGLFLFSFLIGIGNSVVEELVLLSRERRIGLRRHTVICNIGPHNEVLLRELLAYYTKSLRAPRVVTLGPATVRYDYMHDHGLQKIRYRQGNALSSHDLVKVDADRATRVILLGQPGRDVSDSEIVSQVLSVREACPRAAVYAELFHADSVQAALQAGGQRMVPVMASRLVSLYLANIIVFPGIEEVYEELLNSTGQEIYTCVFDEGALGSRPRPSGPLVPFGELLDRTHHAHGVVLLGYLLRDEGAPGGFFHALVPGVPGASGAGAHPAVPPVERLCGFFGVAASFAVLKSFAESLPDVAAPLDPHPGVVVPRFGVCPSASDLQRLLICGFHEGLVDFCEELLLFTRVPSITLLVPEGTSIAATVRAFSERPLEHGTVAHPGSRVLFTAVAGDTVGCALARRPDEQLGTITVRRGDWSDDRVLLHPELRLAELDAVLLTYVPEEADPDARTALALLKLVGLEERGQLRPNFRIFCEVQSADKAALFQRRFANQPAAPQAGSCGTISIIAAERLRNSFLAQAVFVPGILSIYRELLSEAGVTLCKLLPTPLADDEAGSQLTFGELLVRLYERDGFILVAVELGDPLTGERRLVVNPSPRSKDFSFRARELSSIFAIGDFSRAPRSPFCPGCFAAPTPGERAAGAASGSTTAGESDGGASSNTPDATTATTP